MVFLPERFVTGYWYYYVQLTDYEKKVYMYIYEGFKQRRTKNTFPLQKYNGSYPTTQWITDVMLYVLWDHPELYYVDATNAFILCRSKPTPEAMVTYTEYFTPEESAQVERVLRMRVDEVLDMLYYQPEGASKIYCLYSYMMRTIRYMEDISRENSLKNLEARTIVGPLLNHLGVCAGFAKMFKLICDQIGIGCCYVRGKAFNGSVWGNHGWNMVYLDGAFYHVDVTFDMAYYQRQKEIPQNFYLKGDRVISKDHTWNTRFIPSMAHNYSTAPANIPSWSGRKNK